MLNIDEAIAGCKNYCGFDFEELDQLAEWLEDYKRIKMLIPIEQALKAEYNKAIDDFAILMKETLNHDWATTKISEQIIYNRLFDKCNEIAEQLRKCKVDESTD